MAIGEIDKLKELGFEGFVTVSQLPSNYNSIPKIKGVYCIICLEDNCKFLEVGCGGHFKGKNPNVITSLLKTNWVENAGVIYIGKAGGSASKATLHSRLKQYIKFGQGRPVGHWGGRLIWQIENSGNLIVAWKTLSTEEPRDYEMKLISSFVVKYGKRPFANLKD